MGPSEPAQRATDWDSPQHPIVAAPGRYFAPYLLSQTETWTDTWGTVRRIRDMSAEELWEALAYLWWYAPELRATDRQSPSPTRVWLEAQPVWQAVTGALVTRGNISTGEAAYARLASGGRVPWEAIETNG